MAHTAKDKTRLLNRVRRIRGQLNAVESILTHERSCSDVLLTLAACRGAMDSLMAEIIEGHIRHHVIDTTKSPTAAQHQAADELVAVVRRYLK